MLRRKIMKGKGKLFIISGPSGSGKSTLLAEVLEKLDNEYFSVSVTTRAPRPGEIDGVNYLFKTREEFEGMITNGEFLEYTEYAGNYYGTPAEPILRKLEEGKDIFLDIEVVGALQVRKKIPEAVLIFAVPPSFSELERRLRKRSTESEQKIRERLEVARREYKQAVSYDYIVITDKPGDACREILSIVTAEQCRVSQREHLLREV
jgi:guanylate kinase